jgi:hypothetical protein
MYPFFPFVALALWTVSISTTVIADADIAARITGIPMTAHD